MKKTSQDQIKFKSAGHEIINKFLNKETVSWPREMKISKKLLSSYPIEFFRELKNPLKNDAKIPSLAWFLSENGKIFLSKEFFEYQKKNTNLEVDKEEISLSKTKIGEDFKIEKKPTTLKEFLEYYGKKN